MALTDKLTAIADGFRTSRGTEQKYTLDEMAVLAAEKVGGGGAGLNIAYGNTAPDDTTKLWVKSEEPSVVKVTTGMSFDANTLERLGDLSSPSSIIVSAAVGKKVYLFGGNCTDESNKKTKTDKIDVYDSENNKTTTIAATLPTPVLGHACAAVGTKVYIFGGYGSTTLDRIDIFDTETETIRTCSTVLPNALCDISAAAVGTKIYIFGGSQTKIYEFDTETETIRTCSAVLPVSIWGIAAATVGTKVYLFGGYGSSFSNAIYEFDTVGNKVTKLSATLPIYANGIAAAAFGTNVYLFGGGLNYNGKSDAIIVFDAGTGTVETLATSLPNACTYIAAAIIGAKVYLFGGELNSGQLADIYSFSVAAPLDYGVMVLQYTTGGELFPVINSDTLTIKLRPVSVHMGDLMGVAQPVEVFTYKDGAWTAI